MRHENDKQGKRCGSCDLFEVPQCDISRWNENGGLEAPDIEFVVRRLQLKV